MTLQQILTNARERYMQAFLQARGELAANQPKTASEVLISINNEAIPYPYRYLRVDLLHATTEDAPVPTEVRIGPPPSFTPQIFQTGPLKLEVHPFNWNDVQILFNQAPKNIRQIEGWILHCLDINGQNPPNAARLTGAIHSFSQISDNGTWWRFLGDFGTAPIETLVEFVNLLGGQGMTHIVIRSDT